MSNCVFKKITEHVVQKPKFGQLILRKMFKTVAIRCRILRLKCTKIDFGWSSAPDSAGGAYSTPPDSPSWNKRDLLVREGKICTSAARGKGGDSRE